MTTQTLGPDWDEYLDVIREDVHQLLAWSYRDARAKLPTARDEYDITDMLCKALDKCINHHETPERYCLHYVVRCEHPISPQGQRGRDQPRLDVQLVRTGRPQRYFTLEAKRLRDDDKVSASDSIRLYLGNEGIRRFVTGHYAAESFEAAMIGCIQKHDARFWFDLINERFQKDFSSQTNSLGIVEQIRLQQLISDLPDEAVSLHSRQNLPNIRVFHVFLNCN